MSVLTIGPEDGLYYNHATPRAERGLTFVFFNPLTGDTSAWDDPVAAPLRTEGHGTLTFNFRGQKGSPIGDPGAITPDLLTRDATALLQHIRPERPVFVGLSIGGLFAIRTHLEGFACDGFLLINTLRRPSPRLSWINDALYLAARTGGPTLIQDIYLPLLTGPAWQQGFDRTVADRNHEPLGPDHPTARLLACGGEADWNLPYERLAVPILVMSGLQDRIFFEEADVAELTGRLPDAERIDIPDVGHLITMERPGCIVDACLALARKLP